MGYAGPTPRHAPLSDHDTGAPLEVKRLLYQNHRREGGERIWIPVAMHTESLFLAGHP